MEITMRCFSFSSYEVNEERNETGKVVWCCLQPQTTVSVHFSNPLSFQWGFCSFI